VTLRGAHSRRDENIKGGNVVPGFRIEPKAARALTEYARQHFCVDDQTHPPTCDLAAATRYLLRAQLGWSRSNALDTEPLTEATRGCKMEKRLVIAIEKYAAKQGMNGFLPAVRHLLRLGLGYNFAASMDIEQGFAILASRYGELAGAFKP
jgi:hypothetical protein